MVLCTTFLRCWPFWLLSSAQVAVAHHCVTFNDLFTKSRSFEYNLNHRWASWALAQAWPCKAEICCFQILILIFFFTCKRLCIGLLFSNYKTKNKWLCAFQFTSVVVKKKFASYFHIFTMAEKFIMLIESVLGYMFPFQYLAISKATDKWMNDTKTDQKKYHWLFSWSHCWWICILIYFMHAPPMHCMVALCASTVGNNAEPNCHLCSMEYIHCSKSPKISFPILTWLCQQTAVVIL